VKSSGRNIKIYGVNMVKLKHTMPACIWSRQLYFFVWIKTLY